MANRDDDEECNISLTASDVSFSSVLLNSHVSHVTQNLLARPRLQLLDGTFFKYLPEESDTSTTVALCMKCPSNQQNKVKGHSNCTSNFLSHLKRKHGDDCVEEYRLYVKRKKSEKKISNEITSSSRLLNNKQSSIPTTSEEIFEENIVKYFINSMIPLRAVEDPYFSRIFSDLHIYKMGLKIISRRTLNRRIDEYYENKMMTIKSQLDKAAYVSTIIDIWSSKKRSFLGVTAHWITDSLCRNSAALACQRLRGSHTYDRLSETIQQINAEFNLDSNKIVASITDNGSNFIKAFKEFGVQMSNIELTNESTDDKELTSDIDYHDFRSIEDAQSTLSEPVPPPPQ